MADLGYDAQWATVSAASVGAPHRRERVFIVACPADSAGYGRHEGRPESAGLVGRPDVALSGDGPVELLPTPVAHPSGNTPENHLGKKPGRTKVTDLSILVENGLLDTGGELLPTPSVADSTGGHASRSGARSSELLLPGLARAYEHGELLPTPKSTDHKRNSSASELARNTPALGAIEHYLPTPASADADRGPDFARAGRDGSGGDDLVTLCARATREIGTRWGKYEPAIRRWVELTRPAPSPTEPNTKGNPRLAPAFPEWMQGWPAGWCTDPAIGISRNDMLRIIGNGVCPQQAYAAVRSLLSVCGVAA